MSRGNAIFGLVWGLAIMAVMVVAKAVISAFCGTGCTNYVPGPGDPSAADIHDAADTGWGKIMMTNSAAVR